MTNLEAARIFGVTVLVSTGLAFLGTLKIHSSVVPPLTTHYVLPNIFMLIAWICAWFFIIAILAILFGGVKK